MNRIKLFSGILLSCLLAGCAKDYMPPAPPKTDPASTKLAEAAAAVSDSMETLEGIRKAENPDYQKDLVNSQSLGMYSYGSIDYTGPIGPLVERIAAATYFKFRQLGQPPAIPVIVQIHKKDEPLGAILRDADYQAGVKADIVVYQSKRLIELRYRRS